MIDNNKLFYDMHIFCCTNVRPSSSPRGSCARKNSVKLREYMKQELKKISSNRVKIRVNASGCLDRCSLGPVMVIYPDGVWYSFQNKQDVDDIIQNHIMQNTLVERLMI